MVKKECLTGGILRFITKSKQTGNTNTTDVLAVLKSWNGVKSPL
jgi:hypothetical protein